MIEKKFNKIVLGLIIGGAVFGASKTKPGQKAIDKTKVGIFGRLQSLINFFKLGRSEIKKK